MASAGKTEGVEWPRILAVRLPVEYQDDKSDQQRVVHQLFRHR